MSIYFPKYVGISTNEINYDKLGGVYYLNIIYYNIIQTSNIIFQFEPQPLSAQYANVYTE